MRIRWRKKWRRHRGLMFIHFTSKFNKICVFCGSKSGNKKAFNDAALDLGNELVRRRIDLVYGGGSVGLMGLISQKVYDGGCHVLGVIPTALVPIEISGESVGDVKIVADMHERKAEMAQQSDAFIALPGGYGTMEELLEIITWSQLGIHNKPIGLLNVEGYYNPLLALFDNGVRDGFILPAARQIVISAPTARELLEKMEIETEKLLAYLVEAEINKRLKEGTYKGKKFNAICHFFGYQARGALPSKFDCDYAFVLGHICYHILAAGLNGYMATVTNLKNPSNKWRCGAAPITAMMTVKRYSRGPGASSIGKPAVHPATVDLKGKAYELLRQNATKFLMDDAYRNPGPLQFDGPGADSKTVILCIEDADYMGRIKKLQEYLNKVRNMVKPGCSLDVLKVALSQMASVTDVLSVISAPSSTGSTPI